MMSSSPEVPPAGLEARLLEVERALREVQDRLAIYQQTAAYGPAVDRGDSMAAVDLWDVDGRYDWGRGLEPGSQAAADGHVALAAVFDGPEHRSIIEGGAAHWISLPHVVIKGDTASSLCYSCLFMRSDDGFRVARVSSCHFEWRRTATGWVIDQRRNRLLDGSAAARALLGAHAAQD